MKTKAVRLYGKKDLRVEEFELPQISEDEVLAEEDYEKAAKIRDEIKRREEQQ